MTIDEAANILNVKKAGLVAREETELQQMLKVRFFFLSPLAAEGPLPRLTRDAFSTVS